MKEVPPAKEAEWRTKALDYASRKGPFRPVIDLFLESKEPKRLAERLKGANEEDLAELAFCRGEEAADTVAGNLPELAARIHRVLALRILSEKRTRSYPAATRHLAKARDLYRKARLDGEWTKLVDAIRRDYARRSGFMPGFERVVGGETPEESPSLIERAKRDLGL
jgi:hypothetical protein